MSTAIEQVIFTILAATVFLFVIITSFQLYKKFRRRFAARVNCWFCNENTWVPYDDRNQWNCPKCEQYNGFTKDGDYNKELKAQYSPKLNQKPVTRSPHAELSNGYTLCEICNRNQELKVQQLASFVASSEEYYDDEITDYRDQLEDAYRLCPSCEVTLKRQLNKVKGKILGSKLTAQRKVFNKSPLSGQQRRRDFQELGSMFLEKSMVISLFTMTIYLFSTYLEKEKIIKLGSIINYLKLDQFIWILEKIDLPVALGLSLCLMFINWKRQTAPIGVVLLNSIAWSSLSLLNDKNLLIELVYSDFLNKYEPFMKWTLYLTTLITILALFIKNFTKSNSNRLQNVNESFHKIECDLDDLFDQEIRKHSPNINYKPHHYVKPLQSHKSSDLLSNYQTSVSNLSFAGLRNSLDDEEVRSLSMNSSRESLLNKSDSALRDVRQNSFGFKTINQNRFSTTNLHSPTKVFPEDQFSSSIRGLNIGDYNKTMINNGLMKNNPFMKDINITKSCSESLYENDNRSRSLLTPSRLSLVSEHALGTANSTNSWLAGGFWNQHQIEANCQPIFHAKSINSLPSINEKEIADDKFIPIIDSRSSSQSSGFESRQSTGSIYNNTFGFSGVSSREGSVFNDRLTLFSEPNHLFNESISSRKTLFHPPSVSMNRPNNLHFLMPR